MERFTVEETNLICIYLSNIRKKLLGDITGALLLTDAGMRALAEHTFSKLSALSDAEFAMQGFYPAGDE